MLKRDWLTPKNIIGLLVLYSVLYVWQPGGPQVLRVVSDTLYTLFGVLATVLALRASRMFELGSAQQRAWLLCGVTMGVWAVVVLILIYYQLFLNETAPYPSLADILWVIGSISIVVSLVVHYRALGVETNRRRKLIIFVSYLSVLAVALVIVAGSMPASSSQSSLLALLLNVYYLIVDVTLAFIATLYLLAVWGGLVSRPWRYIVISILLVFLGNLIFAYVEWSQTYIMGGNLLSGIVDTAYLAADVVAAAGAYHQLTLRLPSIGD